MLRYRLDTNVLRYGLFQLIRQLQDIIIATERWP